MKKRLVFCILLISFFLSFTFSKSTINVNAKQDTNGYDLATFNEEKLTKMLKDNGVIPDGASYEEINNIVRNYLQGKKLNVNSSLSDNLLAENSYSAKVNNAGHKYGNYKNNLDTQTQNWDGAVTTDKILVLLIDFPDYPHGSINPGETDFYYKDYTKQHYMDMIFGDNGYTGPDGKTYTSMKQYYEQQSGGSYTIEGAIAGWYTAQYPAAYYGGNYPAPYGSDARPVNLVYEALLNAAMDPSINLADYDVQDPFDIDGDGNVHESDGIIDHLMIIHSGVGEEAGGGALGYDAIWSHRFYMGGVAPIPNSNTEVPYWGGLMAAFYYTMLPEDGAAGVFAHEYGHDLGLPDEYDTIYSGAGEPVSYWSLMANGNWAGLIPGTEPTGMSPYAKNFLQSTMPGSNWQKALEVNLSDISNQGLDVILDSATTNGSNYNAVKINLPQQKQVNTPYQGKYEYFSGSGSNLNNYMYTYIDLTDATKSLLTFKAWYQIEKDWDYASVFVMTEDGSYYTIPGNITTTYNPNGQNPGNGITGQSKGWVDAAFDLSMFAGQKIIVGFNYWTDMYTNLPGFYADDITITKDNKIILKDNGETNNEQFTFAGFTKADEGLFTTNHYYLVEFRNYQGTDIGLSHINIYNNLVPFYQGMVIWYANDAYGDNWVGDHPGEGFLGVVDADQTVNTWNTGSLCTTPFQIHDAAFSLYKNSVMYLDYSSLFGLYTVDNSVSPNSLFSDNKDYTDNEIRQAGLNLPTYGLKIKIIAQDNEQGIMMIHISK